MIRVARNREPGTRLADIAKDFGISESCLNSWLTRADRDDGVRPGATTGELNEVLLWGTRMRRGSSRESKEIEILVLRHELEILRRQQGRPRLEPNDRAWLALLSRLLSRERWSVFLVRPETLLGWHRRMVSRHWTFEATPKGRPPLGDELVALIVRHRASHTVSTEKKSQARIPAAR